MDDIVIKKELLSKNGFVIIEDVFSDGEIVTIISTINETDKTKETFRTAGGLFAVRQFLKEVPAATQIIFNEKLKRLIGLFLGNDYFVTKSIYFDKPATSNWFVSYHQDLTISVDKKVDLEGFGPWTVKQNQFAVQPPHKFLENNFTIRIHLDNTDENNGALKVIPGSHLKNIFRPGTIDWSVEPETTCRVRKGGVMIMKPLLLHSSGRTTNQKERRVVHIEFSNQELPGEIKWSERINC